MRTEKIDVLNQMEKKVEIYKQAKKEGLRITATTIVDENVIEVKVRLPEKFSVYVKGTKYDLTFVESFCSFTAIYNTVCPLDNTTISIDFKIGLKGRFFEII